MLLVQEENGLFGSLGAWPLSVQILNSLHVLTCFYLQVLQLILWKYWREQGKEQNEAQSELQELGKEREEGTRSSHQGFRQQVSQKWRRRLWPAASSCRRVNAGRLDGNRSCCSIQAGARRFSARALGLSLVCQHLNLHVLPWLFPTGQPNLVPSEPAHPSLILVAPSASQTSLQISPSRTFLVPPTYGVASLGLLLETRLPYIFLELRHPELCQPRLYELLTPVERWLNASRGLCSCVCLPACWGIWVGFCVVVFFSQQEDVFWLVLSLWFTAITKSFSEKP